MEIIDFNNPLFDLTNNIEHDIFAKDKKFPEFVFASPFDRYYFLWDSMSFKTQLKLYSDIVMPLMSESKTKNAILTSLNPSSNGHDLFKFKFGLDDSSKEFNKAMNFKSVVQPVNGITPVNYIMIGTVAAFYSMDKSWALVGDSWDTDITVLGINNSLIPFVNTENLCTLENVSELLFFIKDKTIKDNILKKIQQNYNR